MTLRKSHQVTGSIHLNIFRDGKLHGPSCPLHSPPRPCQAGLRPLISSHGLLLQDSNFQLAHRSPCLSGGHSNAQGTERGREVCVGQYLTWSRDLANCSSSGCSSLLTLATKLDCCTFVQRPRLRAGGAVLGTLEIDTNEDSALEILVQR